MTRVCKTFYDHRTNLIFILFNKPVDVVGYIAREVANGELLLQALFRTFERIVVLEHGINISEETFIISSCTKHDLLFKNLKQGWPLDVLNQLDCLDIVFEFDDGPVDAFLTVLLLFFCEHMLVELLLQLFVCIVNDQLLKTIFNENLKSKDVKKANEV